MDVLGTPGKTTALRDLRIARGWSQMRLVLALEAAAAAERMAVAERDSLKVTVSRWENGHQCPDQMYRHLLASVFGVDETQLGLNVATPAASPMAGSRLSPRVIGPEVVGYFTTVLDQYVTADQMLGPGHVRGVVAEQARQLHAVAFEAAEPHRTQLLRLLVHYAEFAGWLCQDSGALDQAENWTARAADLAAFADDPQLTAYTAIRRAGIATEARRVADARLFAETGLRNARILPPQLVALGARQLAQTAALTGDARACRSSVSLTLDSTAASEDGNDPDDLLAYASPGYLRMEAGAGLALLGDHSAATDLYRAALETWPDEQQRDRGLCLARLTDAQAAAGAVLEACATGAAAVDVQAAAPSARARASLKSARNRLHRHRALPEVIELTHRLAAVV